MIPQQIPKEWYYDSICSFTDRWIVTMTLADKLAQMASFLPFPLQIISGYRTPEQQAKLIQEGKGAPDHLSTHRSCPATGADVWPAVAVTRVVKATVGEAGVRAGLRWGGGSPVDPETGIPEDWNHFDEGPRAP
jgi:hypothetical protein